MRTEATNRKAAVIVPVFKTSAGELRVLLVRRGPGGVHGGQIAFPGGMHDDCDLTPLDTALRELNEELAVTRGETKVLAELSPVETLTTGVRVIPFVVQMLNPGGWRPSECEIAEVFELPVEHFARPESHDFGFESFAGWPEPRCVAFYRVESYRVWGLTYRILESVVPRLLAGEWKID